MKTERELLENLTNSPPLEIGPMTRTFSRYEDLPIPESLDGETVRIQGKEERYKSTKGEWLKLPKATK